MQKTLLLDQKYWDLVLDASGDIACATDPYSISQDVASAVRTFLGECWYDTSQGVTYWQDILGEAPPMSLVKSKIEQSALTVNSVKTATCSFISFQDRQLVGVIELTDINGDSHTVNLMPLTANTASTHIATSSDFIRWAMKVEKACSLGF